MGHGDGVDVVELAVVDVALGQLGVVQREEAHEQRVVGPAQRGHVAQPPERLGDAETGRRGSPDPSGVAGTRPGRHLHVVHVRRPPVPTPLSGSRRGPDCSPGPPTVRPRRFWIVRARARGPTRTIQKSGQAAAQLEGAGGDVVGDLARARSGGPSCGRDERPPCRRGAGGRPVRRAPPPTPARRPPTGRRGG